MRPEPTQSLPLSPFRRLPYMDLPFDVQQEIVHAVFADLKSAQTNLERGNIAAYALGPSSKADKRWATLQFPSDAMSVNSSTGEVRLYPHYIGSNVDTVFFVWRSPQEQASGANGSCVGRTLAGSTSPSATTVSLSGGTSSSLTMRFNEVLPSAPRSSPPSKVTAILGNTSMPPNG